MKLALVCVCAILLDRWLGEQRRWHRLIGFGRLAQKVETLGYGPPETSKTARRLRGLSAWLLLIIPFALLAWALSGLAYLGLVAQAILLYLALGAASLAQHAKAVQAALDSGDLPLARIQ